MHRFTLLWLTVAVILLAACSSNQPDNSVTVPQPATSAQVVTPVAIQDLQLATGQVVFVPAYSEVFYFNRDRTLNLAITLAIHNTDLQNPIIVKSARYYDTNGNLVQEYINEPVQLGPMGTMSIVLNQDDDRGGFGANFIVEWGAETRVYEPVIEAVMITTTGSQGVSLLSPGRVISQTQRVQ